MRAVLGDVSGERDEALFGLSVLDGDGEALWCAARGGSGAHLTLCDPDWAPAVELGG